MKKILAFSGSFSADSINHQLVTYAVGFLKEADVSVIRLADFAAPIYRKELEVESGIPENIEKLRILFDEADAFLISTPEYNSSIPAGLKNTVDWLSRMEGSIFRQKPVLLLAASPGGRGGQSILNHLTAVMPFWGAELIGTFSLPKFNDNFSDGKISDAELNRELTALLERFNTKVSSS